MYLLDVRTYNNASLTWNETGNLASIQTGTNPYMASGANHSAANQSAANRNVADQTIAYTYLSDGTRRTKTVNGRTTIAGVALVGSAFASTTEVITALGMAGGAAATAAGTNIGAKISANINMTKIYDPIFSADHISKGILNLGTTKQDIVNEFMKIISNTSSQWQAGSNEIRMERLLILMDL